MAFYKYSSYLKQNQHNAFDTTTNPGSATPYSGIYKCEGCGQEIVSTQEHPMPPQNHHQHTHAQGQIRWKLIVATE